MHKVTSAVYVMCKTDVTALKALDVMPQQSGTCINNNYKRCYKKQTNVYKQYLTAYIHIRGQIIN